MKLNLLIKTFFLLIVSIFLISNVLADWCTDNGFPRGACDSVTEYNNVSADYCDGSYVIFCYQDPSLNYCWSNYVPTCTGIGGVYPAGVCTNCSNGIASCDADGDGYAGNLGDFTNYLCLDDCNDANSTIHPNASENTTSVCTDGVDNNCNGLIDCTNETGCMVQTPAVFSPLNTTYNRFLILINFTANSTLALDKLWWYNGTGNTFWTSAIWKNATYGSSTYTFYANNTAGCSNHTNITFFAENCSDYDGDDYGIGADCAGTDCDDTNITIWQNLGGFLDSDSDTYTVGDNTTICSGATLPSNYKLVNTTSDCDDTNASLYQNLTGFTDVDLDTYTTGTSSQVCSGASLPSGYVGANTTTDCDDTNITIWQNLGGFLDSDSDTYTIGDNTTICSGASLPSNYKSANTTTDCDDTNASLYQNLTGFTDVDLDTYTTGTSSQVCSGASLPSGYVGANTTIDCDDTSSAIYPGATDVCGNGIDEDCSGTDLTCTGGGSSCFPAGTLIKMADGSEKKIEQVKVSDLILSYDTFLDKFVNSQVLELENPIRSGYYLIEFDDDSNLRITGEHPVWIRKR